MTDQIVCVRVVEGHRVASGLNGDARFPGGTLRMQAPFFRALGLDLGPFHAGTLNVSLSPMGYRMLQPKLTFRHVRWHPTEPAEDFSFFDVQLLRPNAASVAGLVYYPHPETKPAHFQKPDVLELLLPFVEGLQYGRQLTLSLPTKQIQVIPPPQSQSQPSRPRAR